MNFSGTQIGKLWNCASSSHHSYRNSYVPVFFWNLNRSNVVNAVQLQSDPKDALNFDARYTSKIPVLTPESVVISSLDQELFSGFSYENKNFTSNRKIRPPKLKTHQNDGPKLPLIKFKSF